MNNHKSKTMKKLFLLFSLLLSTTLLAQNVVWYEVFFEVSPADSQTAVRLIDNHYSSLEIPEDVTVELFRIPFKGASEKATHVLSFYSESSKSLADFRGSLKGAAWSTYTTKMSNIMKSYRTTAGKDLYAKNTEVQFPIGQAWNFNVKSYDVGAFMEAFAKLNSSVEFEGFIAAGQTVHGTDNGENIYIYGTYADLNSALDSGPKNVKESEAFNTFFKAIESATYKQTQTRVLIKRF